MKVDKVNNIIRMEKKRRSREILVRTTLCHLVVDKKANYLKIKIVSSFWT